MKQSQLTKHFTKFLLILKHIEKLLGNRHFVSFPMLKAQFLYTNSSCDVHLWILVIIVWQRSNILCRSPLMWCILVKITFKLENDYTFIVLFMSQSFGHCNSLRKDTLLFHFINRYSKSIWKNSLSFPDKNSQKLSIEGIYLNILKAICDKQTS